MSIATAPGRTLPPPGQPYYYGYRDVHRTLADGSRRHERIALTLEDALHPEEGDFIMEGPLHDLLRSYLAEVARARLASDPHAEVLSNCGVYWHHPDFDHHAPDVALVFGVRRKDLLERSSFDVPEQGVRPRWIFELVSPNTRSNDVETKLDQYHQVEVPYFVIFDREEEDADWTVIGYQWTPSGYLRLNTDDRGRLWVDCLNLWVACEGRRIVCYDGVTDAAIGDYTAVSAELEKVRQLVQEEAARANAEKARADAAEARLRELESKLARPGAHD